MNDDPKFNGAGAAWMEWSAANLGAWHGPDPSGNRPMELFAEGYASRHATIVALLADRDAQEARAERAEAEVARLRAALEDIANPLAAFQRDVESGGGRINEMAHRIVNDPAHLQRIARLALQGDGP